MSKTRILVLRANPKDMPDVQLGDEIKAIRSGIGRSKGDDRFEVIEPPEVTPGTLTPYLVGDAQPHVVHFSGHGGLNRFLLLTGLDKLSVPVAADTLAAEFRALADAGRRVRCVVLNACYS